MNESSLCGNYTLCCDHASSSSKSWSNKALIFTSFLYSSCNPVSWLNTDCCCMLRFTLPSVSHTHTHTHTQSLSYSKCTNTHITLCVCVWPPDPPLSKMNKHQAQSSCLACSREQAGHFSACWQQNRLVNYNTVDNSETTTADSGPPQGTDGVDVNHPEASQTEIQKRESLKLTV